MNHKSDYSAYIGLDVHKETIAVAIADSGRIGEVRFWGNIVNRPVNIRNLFNKLLKNHADLLVCYEAGCCGFGVYRLLTSVEIDCVVIAPSRRVKSPTDRIKNDHRDAVALARLLRAGELVSVWVPDEVHEAMRDLIRARFASKRDMQVARQRVQSLLLRANRIYDKKSWTVRHRI